MAGRPLIWAAVPPGSGIWISRNILAGTARHPSPFGIACTPNTFATGELVWRSRPIPRIISGSAKVLHDLRIEADLTQTELADRLGVPQSFVSEYENGERRLDLIELRQVVDALGVPPGVLLERFDPSWFRTD